MEAPCHICSGRARFLLSKDGHDLYRCPRCGLIFVFPQPASEFLSTKVYSKDSGYQSHKPRDLSKVLVAAAYEKVFAYLEKEGIKGRLLDVGCSNGEFLYPAKQAGFEVSGVELNPYTAEIAKENGLDVRVGVLSDIKFEPASFKVIFLGDLIEHVENPRELLIQCKNLLAEGGRLVISTPNMDAPWARLTFALYKIFGIPWSCVTPPYHLFQFSRDNLVPLLEQCGLIYKTEWYNRRPSFMYERGQTHLVREWRARKGLKRFLFGAYMFFSLGIYSVCYALADLIGLFGYKKDSAMVVVAVKSSF